MIRFENVYFSYEESNWAVENLSISIEKGEFVALLGSNGSGKSTIARLANGLFLPNKGAVLIDGKPTSEIREQAKAKVGLVFQNPDDQFVGTTVEEDLAFGLENLGIERREAKERIARISELLKIKQYLRSSPSMLSGGEKQKVAIAGILVMQPDYLVLDEITALLDPASRKEIFSLVKDISEERGMGVLYITHISDESLSADKIILLDKGKKIAEGKPFDLLRSFVLLNSAGVSVPDSVFLSEHLQRLKVIKETVLTEEALLSEI